MELLFLIGLMWASTRAFEALREPAKAGWAKHKSARAGTTPASRAKARTARLAASGYWAGEIAHGLPHARRGWAQGWAEHRVSREEAARDHARVTADHEGRIARIRAEMAAHKHRLQVARDRAAKPTMTDQLKAERDNMRQRGNGCTDKDCDCHKEDKPAQNPGGKPPGQRAPGSGDPPLPDGNTPGNGPPGPSNGHNPGGNKVSESGGDFNYDGVLQVCDELVAEAEEAANSPAIDKASALSDELGAMLNNDSGALSKAASVTKDAQDAKTAASQLVEDAQALKDHVVTNYGPIKEAVDASEGTAPEKQFVDS
jgi:hypothetical protein